MADPNKPVSQQLLREAKIGLTIVAMLVGLFCYVAWNRFSGNWDSIPAHVANAPVAKNMNEAFREQHRQHLAKVNRSSQEDERQNDRVRNTFVSNGNTPKTDSSNQTFTSDKSRPKPDKLTSSQNHLNPPSPFGNNDLRPAAPQGKNDANVESASYDQEAKSEPEEFDDPFGQELPPLEIDQPKIDANTRSTREPFAINPRNMSSHPKTNEAQIKTVPEEADSGFRPRTKSKNGTNPSVVMQSTRFQVQVDPEPDNEAQQTLAVQDVTDVSPTEVSRANDFKSRTVVEHKPLENAGDFATHSLHPLRPTVEPTQPKDTIKTPIEEVPSQRPVRQESVTKMKGQYTVQDADQTLWSIAQDVYGDGRLFRAIYEMNRNAIPDPDQLSIGTTLLTPPIEEVVKNLRDHVPQDMLPVPDSPLTYETSKGDTLFDIARQKLGQASRFDELVKLNRERLPLDTNHLSPLPAGMQLKLPAE